MENEQVGLLMEYFDYVRALWRDAGVKECFKRSNEYQLIDKKIYAVAIEYGHCKLIVEASSNNLHCSVIRNFGPLWPQVQTDIVHPSPYWAFSFSGTVPRVPHFLDRIDLIEKSDYVPSDADILRCRQKTSGIQKIEFKVKDKGLRICNYASKVFTLTQDGGSVAPLHCEAQSLGEDKACS
ncbi:hypothetical protein MSG28_015153 [Choristoneura fumiferana]|uniref:Uncharacterized protein n=1 Tax=Choristoneura fumiferana TaxID=7141 RepID=A0ACC0KZN3_CHOFU|nr:hypothetical protein MSG28_015153 [Choristoneura fumiferana]